VKIKVKNIIYFSFLINLNKIFILKLDLSNDYNKRNKKKEIITSNFNLEEPANHKNEDHLSPTEIEGLLKSTQNKNDCINKNYQNKNNYQTNFNSNLILDDLMNGI